MNYSTSGGKYKLSPQSAVAAAALYDDNQQKLRIDEALDFAFFFYKIGESEYKNQFRLAMKEKPPSDPRALAEQEDRRERLLSISLWYECMLEKLRPNKIHLFSQVYHRRLKKNDYFSRR